MSDLTRSVPACTRPDVSSVTGYCKPHHQRIHRTGRAGPPEIQASRAPECSIEGCTASGRRRGLCAKHAYRKHANGDPLVTRPVGQPAGDDHPKFKGDAIGYNSAHARVGRRRGKAAAQSCTYCGLAARHWAVIHEHATLVDPDLGLSYSADPDDYVPLCVPCHSAYDHEQIVLTDRWSALPVA